MLGRWLMIEGHTQLSQSERLDNRLVPFTGDEQRALTLSLAHRQCGTTIAPLANDGYA
jgi:hypothetical protein